MIEHLSYSSISTYLMCPANWKFKYIDQLETPTAPELVFGSAFHNTVEAFVVDKTQDITTLWSEKWSKQLIGETVAWDTANPAELHNDGLRILTHKDVLAGILSIQAKQIETKVELRVPGVSIPIVGYIDVITSDGIPGDFKTSKSSWSADKALNEVQPLFYLAAMNQMGMATPGWNFRHYIFVKTKTPQYQVIDHVHHPGQLMWLFGMIGKVWKAIEGRHFPENPTGWKCSPNYCEFWSRCRGK